MKDDPHHHAHSYGTEQVGDGVLLWTTIINLGLYQDFNIERLLTGS